MYVKEKNKTGKGIVSVGAEILDKMAWEGVLAEEILSSYPNEILECPVALWRMRGPGRRSTSAIYVFSGPGVLERWVRPVCAVGVKMEGDEGSS